LCAVIAASLSLPMPFVPARKLTSRRILPRIKAETTLSSRQQSMPLYEYQCKKCHHRFEKIQKFSDPHVKKCPDFGGPVEQVISRPFRTKPLDTAKQQAENVHSRPTLEPARKAMACRGSLMTCKSFTRIACRVLFLGLLCLPLASAQTPASDSQTSDANKSWT